MECSAGLTRPIGRCLDAATFRGNLEGRSKYEYDLTDERRRAKTGRTLRRLLWKPRTERL